MHECDSDLEGEDERFSLSLDLQTLTSEIFPPNFMIPIPVIQITTSLVSVNKADNDLEAK